LISILVLNLKTHMKSDFAYLPSGKVTVLQDQLIMMFTLLAH
jgi:hypothetical protein